MSFPTEQAIQQKEGKKKKVERLKAAGHTEEEIRMMTRRKPQVQEKHYDDCGSDFGPIDDKESTFLSHPCGTLNDMVSYCFRDDISEQDVMRTTFSTWCS